MTFNFRKSLITFFFTLGFFGCASVDNSELEIRRDPDLVKEFKLDQEKFKDFQQVSVNQITDLPKKVSSSSSIPNEKKIKLRESVEKIVNPPKEKINKEILKISDEQVYPEGYPESFKDYNVKFKKTWSLFRPRIFYGEEVKLDIKYFGIICGSVILRTLGM